MTALDLAAARSLAEQYKTATNNYQMRLAFELAELAGPMAAEIERLRAELEQYRDAVLHMLALAAPEYRQTIVAARAAGSSGDYAKNNGRAESIRLFATGLAERAGLPVIDWEQIKRDVPVDGVYRAESVGR